jgi:hypothetical protein
MALKTILTVIALAVTISCNAGEPAAKNKAWVTGFWHMTNSGEDNDLLDTVMEFRTDGAVVLYDDDCSADNPSDAINYRADHNDIHVTSNIPDEDPVTLTLHANPDKTKLAITWPDTGKQTTFERTFACSQFSTDPKLNLPSGTNTAQSYTEGDNLLSVMDAYSRAVNLQPLRPSGDDELRIWSTDYMSGRITGVAISKNTAIRCNTKYNYSEDGITTIEPATCQRVLRWHKNKDAIAALDTISALDGKQWDCPVFDGYGVYIEGVRNGKRFALRVSNPDACNDPDSKAVVNFLSRIGILNIAVTARVQ